MHHLRVRHSGRVARECRLQHFPDAERDAQLGRCHGSRGFPAGTLLMKSPDPRPTLAAPDDDPYLWLEEIEGAGALAWVEAQNAATLRRFADARFRSDREVLKSIFDRPDNIPYPNRRGGRVFNFWRDEDRKSTRLNSSHVKISYAVFCLKKKKKGQQKGRATTTQPKGKRKKI